MMRTMLAGLVLCLAAAGLTATGAVAGKSSITVTAQVPETCDFDKGAPFVTNDDVLFISLPVERNCNTAHELKVTYEPESLTYPHALIMYFGGHLPDQRTPGAMTFANLPHTNGAPRTRLLRIFYVGPEWERKKIKKTFKIYVTH